MAQSPFCSSKPRGAWVYCKVREDALPSSEDSSLDPLAVVLGCVRKLLCGPGAKNEFRFPSSVSLLLFLSGGSPFMNSHPTGGFPRDQHFRDFAPEQLRSMVLLADLARGSVGQREEIPVVDTQPWSCACLSSERALYEHPASGS